MQACSCLGELDVGGGGSWGTDGGGDGRGASEWVVAACASWMTTATMTTTMTTTTMSMQRSTEEVLYTVYAGVETRVKSQARRRKLPGLACCWAEMRSFRQRLMFPPRSPLLDSPLFYCSEHTRYKWSLQYAILARHSVANLPLYLVASSRARGRFSDPFLGAMPSRGQSVRVSPLSLNASKRAHPTVTPIQSSLLFASS
jgi:hypothetical protein